METRRFLFSKQDRIEILVTWGDEITPSKSLYIKLVSRVEKLKIKSRLRVRVEV